MYRTKKYGIVPSDFAIAYGWQNTKQKKIKSRKQ